MRGRRPDGRHDIETVFAFCEQGDALEGESFEAPTTGFSLSLDGPFASDLTSDEPNLVERAWSAATYATGVKRQTNLRLTKNLPVASGLGGGSADAAATLRLLTLLWGADRALAARIAPGLGSDVPACVASKTARGSGAGEVLQPVDLDLSGTPVLLVNPRVHLATRDVFAGWDGEDRGPVCDWRSGRNDLEAPARRLVPQIGLVLAWLEAQPGVQFVRMSGSGATCFALFDSHSSRDAAATAVPREWWHLATRLR